jgi:hypothetical protein
MQLSLLKMDCIFQVHWGRAVWHAGGQYAFKGKIKYRPCRTPVFPPSNWTGSLAHQSAEGHVNAGLSLEFVHSYEGKENTTNNLFYNSLGDVVYYIAGLGVVYNPTRHTQVFFKGHSNDIRCLAMDAQRRCHYKALISLRPAGFDCTCYQKCAASSGEQ